MGCDAPAPKQHVLRIGSETVSTYTCPRKMCAPAAQYMRLWNWREKNCLHYIYPDALPAKVGAALDFIDGEMGARQERMLDREGS